MVLQGLFELSRNGFLDSSKLCPQALALASNTNSPENLTVIISHGRPSGPQIKPHTCPAHGAIIPPNQPRVHATRVKNMAAIGQDPTPLAPPENVQAHGAVFFASVGTGVVSDGRERSLEVRQGGGAAAVTAAEGVASGEEEVEDDEGGDAEEDEEEGGDEDHDDGFEEEREESGVGFWWVGGVWEVARISL